MTQYDQEFEVFWNAKVIEEAGDRLKLIAYSAWQAARTPQQPEVKPLELEFGNYAISTYGSVFEIGGASSHNLSKLGRERKTRELAEAAAEKMRKRDRLHAFATKFMGVEYAWIKDADNTFLYFDHVQSIWSKSSDKRLESAGTVYMTYECAEYLCAALNEGRLVP
jgi:hypothetical protein